MDITLGIRVSTNTGLFNAPIQDVPLAKTLVSIDSGRQYEGGSIPVAVTKSDTQENVVRRGLEAHARAAGLRDEIQIKDFVDKWTNADRDKDGTVRLSHWKNGVYDQVSDDDFAKLYQPNTVKGRQMGGETNYIVSGEKNAELLADLNARVTAQNSEAAEVLEDGEILRVETNEEKVTLDVRETKGATAGERALRAYIRENYGTRGEVFGDKLNELMTEAKTKGIGIESAKQFGANAVTGYISAENKEKLDALYAEAVGATRKGIEAGQAGAQDTIESYQDFYKIQANGAIKVVNDASKLVDAPAIAKFETKGSYWKKDGREQVGEITSTIGSSIATGGLGTAGKVINAADTIVSTNEAISGEDMRTGEQLSTTQRVLQGIGAAVSTPSAVRDADEAVTQIGKKASEIYNDIGKGGGLPSLADDFARRWQEAQMKSGLGGWQPQTANNAPMAATDDAAKKATVDGGTSPISEAEQAKRLAEEARIRQIETKYDEIAQNGHAVQRHGEHITEKQLDDRAMFGKDPITGTTNDAFRKDASGNALPHKSGKDATQFVSKQALVKAEEFVRNSQQYKDALANATSSPSNSFAVKGVKLEDIFGANYKNQVLGKTRLGTRNKPIGVVETDFTDGTVKAAFKRDSNGNWNLETMYPESAN